MRALRRNTTKLWYSIQGEQTPIYEKDEEGHIIYDEMPDGTLVARVCGEVISEYGKPVEFYGNISGSGGKAQDTPYGVDLSGYDAVLYSVKGRLPINELTLIWCEKPDEEVDPNSADYIVRRVPPCLNEVIYLLERVPNEKICINNAE